MNVSAAGISPLSNLNADLARFFRKPPLGFSIGADKALEDDLVICGILGGKDIGKSTLINALAGTRVSVDESEVGRGTDRPRAYVHRSRRDALLRRLAENGQRKDIDLVPHDADAIAAVVLVDLPDFDSEFLDHLHIVQRVAPRLDRILWVQSPRKLGDRAWVAMLREVVKDLTNVHLVLNKVDELLADGELEFEERPKSDRLERQYHGENRLESRSSIAERPETGIARTRSPSAFWSAQRRWVADAIAAAGCDLPDDRLFLVAGLYPDVMSFTARIAHRWDDPEWRLYGVDRPLVEQVAVLATADIDRLRATVMGPLHDARVRQIKSANHAAEQHTWALRLDEHFGLTRTRDLLQAAVDPAYHQPLLNTTFGRDYGTVVGAQLSRQLRGDADLADELLASRVDRWPLLRLAYFPLGWLSRVMGRQLSLIRGLTPAHSTGDWESAMDVDHRTLADRVALYRERLRADHAAVCTDLHVEDEWPGVDRLTQGLIAAARGLPMVLEREMLFEMGARDRRPSMLSRGLVWFIFLWFPILQPITAGVLGMRVAGGSWEIAQGLAQLATALSAVHLLAGFAVVAIIFVLLIAGMYARCLKDVRRHRVECLTPDALALRVDDLLFTGLTAPLIRPLMEKRQVLQRLWDRVHALRSSPQVTA